MDEFGHSLARFTRSINGLQPVAVFLRYDKRAPVAVIGAATLLLWACQRVFERLSQIRQTDAVNSRQALGLCADDGTRCSTRE